MNFYPTKVSRNFLVFFILSLILILSCSKDSDLLKDAVLDPTISVIDESEQNQETEDEAEEETTEEETVDEETVIEDNEATEKIVEPRTTIFTPIHDAHLQSGKGYDHEIVRLEEGHRSSYLMFDLSEIDSIGGKVTEINLEFTIDTDDGHGTITVHKGDNSSWSESALNETSAPLPQDQLGEIETDYRIGETHEIHLDTTNIQPNLITLVLTHTDGDDLAFASKEHSKREGPKLVVSYDAPQDAEAINDGINDIVLPEENENNGNTTDNPSETEEDTNNEVPSEDNPEEEPSAETPVNEPDSNTEEQRPDETEEETQEPIEESPSPTPDSNNEADAEENEGPTAIAEAAPTTGKVPLKVGFKGGSSIDDKGIESYEWDFGDGNKSSEVSPNHTYTKSGNFEAKLTVKDKEGLSHSDVVSIKVEEEEKNDAPKSLPEASPSSGTAPLDVQFKGDNSTDDKEITEYFWDFKDGSSSNEANPSHTFSDAGEYKVVLTVKDKEGLTNARIVVVNVIEEKNEAPVAVANGTPLSGNAPLEVQFNANSSTDDKGVTSYFWDFKDGSTTTNRNPSHTFNESGTYDVVLSVKDAEGLTHSTSIEVNVNESSSGSSGGGSSEGSGGSNSNPSNGVKASSFGFNSSDATQALDAAINSSHNVIIVDKQSSDWVVGPLYFNRINNKTIIFENGVVLRAKRGAFRDSDRLFQFVNSSNITIEGYGATFQMNKSEYSGQQNHALSLVTCANVNISGLTFKDAGGDGIYVSRYNEGDYCSNISIKDVVSTSNRRQGITILSVKGLTISNSTFSASGDKDPGSGIDFEPESTRDRFEDVLIQNCTFKDNFGPGILFALSKVNGNSVPLDVTFKNIKVSNNYSTSNPRPYRTEIDLGMSTNYRTNPIKGNITFDGLTVENSKWSAIYTKKTLEAYHVKFKNTVIRNVSKSSDLPAIDIGILDYANTSNANMGGFTFENVLIDYDGVDPSLQLHGPSDKNWNLRNMYGTIRVKSPRGTRFVDNTNVLSSTNHSSVTLRIVED